MFKVNAKQKHRFVLVVLEITETRQILAVQDLRMSAPNSWPK